MSVVSQVNEWVAIAANWLSLVSLVASVYAALTIRRVRRDIAGRATLPSTIEALEDVSSDLAELMQNFEPNQRAVALQFARCEGNLRSIVVSQRSIAPRARDLIAKIGAYDEMQGGNRPVTLPIDEAWTIYRALIALVEELRRLAQVHRIGG